MIPVHVFSLRTNATHHRMWLILFAIDYHCEYQISKQNVEKYICRVFIFTFPRCALLHVILILGDIDQEL